MTWKCGMTWIKAGVAIKALSGEKLITYVSRENPRIRIESLKEQMPRANGGFWWFTSFSVILDGKTVKNCRTLKEAKSFAESLDLEVDL